MTTTLLKARRKEQEIISSNAKLTKTKDYTVLCIDNIQQKLGIKGLNLEISLKEVLRVETFSNVDGLGLFLRYIH